MHPLFNIWELSINFLIHIHLVCWVIPKETIWACSNIRVCWWGNMYDWLLLLLLLLLPEQGSIIISCYRLSMSTNKCIQWLTIFDNSKEDIVTAACFIFSPPSPKSATIFVNLSLWVHELNLLITTSSIIPWTMKAFFLLPWPLHILPLMLQILLLFNISTNYFSWIKRQCWGESSLCSISPHGNTTAKKICFCCKQLHMTQKLVLRYIIDLGLLIPGMPVTS